MDGPYTQVLWSHNSLPRSKRKSILLLQQFSTHLPEKTLRRSSASYFGRLHLFTMSASYWPPCTATFTPSQRQTTASTQQNGNHSLTFSTIVLQLPHTITFISLLALDLSSSNIQQYHPNPNFPVTSPSNVMFGSDSAIQAVRRDGCPTHRKRLYFGQKSLFYHFSNLYLPLNRSTQMTVAAAADAFGTEDEMGIGGWIKLENNLFRFSHIWNRHELPGDTKKPSTIYFFMGSITTLEQRLTSTMVSLTQKSSPISSNWSPFDRSNAIFLNIHHIPGEKNTDADDLVEAESQISAKVHES